MHVPANASSLSWKVLQDTCVTCRPAETIRLKISLDRHDTPKRPIHTERVYGLYVRRATRAAHLRPSTRVYADMEHMKKGLRVHTKRVYVRRRT